MIISADVPRSICIEGFGSFGRMRVDVWDFFFGFGVQLADWSNWTGGEYTFFPIGFYRCSRVFGI